MKKSLIALLFLLVPFFSRAQFNVNEMGKKLIYFGIHLGINAADFKVIRQPFLLQNDSIKMVTASIGPGFNLGIIGNYQFNKHFDLRFIPSLIFSDKNIDFKLKNNRLVSKTISSIYLDFPVEIRFKSDPIKDAKIYVIAGMKYDFDLASNQKARKADDIVKLVKHDVSVEYGIGVMIYFPYFILSPEFKMGHSILNVHTPTNGLIYSRVIDKLFSRSFTFSINLEG